jgi:hypothetical protein
MMISPTTTTTMTCPECQLDGGPFEVAEVALHVATHNWLHHAGAPIAIAVTSVCTKLAAA